MWKSVATTAALVLAAGLCRADKPFTDSRDRFKLTLPPGWELAPQPGDTEGMVFRRRAGDVPGIVSVKVSLATATDAHGVVMDKRVKPFEREIGYDKLQEGEAKVGDFRALRRVHTVFLNGDSELKRYSVDHVLLAYGNAHYIHFETAEGHYKDFQRDLDAMLRTYAPLAGRATYAAVVGRWQQVGGGEGPALVLAPDQFFELGARNGTYRADGKRLTFIETLGQEQFRYLVDEDVLTLQGDRLKEPVSYRRDRAGVRMSRKSDEEQEADARRALKITRELVVGAWVVAEGGDAFEMLLSEGGAFRFGPMTGRYTLKDNLLSVESASGVRVTYHLSHDGKRLRMMGGDLDKPLVLERRQ